jgi:N-acetylmuramoyl-L-alanine amidase
MNNRLLFKCIFIFAIALMQSAGVFAQPSSKDFRLAQKVKKEILEGPDQFSAWQHMGQMYVDSVAADASQRTLSIFLSPDVSRIPIREAWVRHIENTIKAQIGRRFRSFRLHLFCKGEPLEKYVPVFFNKYSSADSSRLKAAELRIPLVKKADAPMIRSGLRNKNIALWASHGHYYESGLDRWEWQRARLFGTVEDLYPLAYTRNFLVPMLENAGANVLLTRERDTQVQEVIVDNDGSTDASEIIIKGRSKEWERSPENGFARMDTLFSGDNPFSKGSYLQISTSEDKTGKIVYLPDIPEDGIYAVYVSWGKVEGALDAVPYCVKHTGGSSTYFVNQQMSYGTWVFLGAFHFKEGKDEALGAVEIEVPQRVVGMISTDAIRFGGGMGNVARRPEGAYVKNKQSLNDNQASSIELPFKDAEAYTYKVSGKPRWMEAARYWLQYAGFPDSTVYSLTDGQNDYNDDYQSRGEWVNYLMDLNIPVDLAFAFHTDAGVTPGDSTIGTLGIYSSVTNDGKFSDGKSRMASRDLTDVIQTQIVSDIRLTFNNEWTRRAMWDKQYSEAWRPNVPTMLLELLSHQNLADMRYGLDPRFQFTVSRAVYKGMVRFLAAREGCGAVITPLAPDQFSLESIGGNRVRLSWRAVDDPLEPSAQPLGYKVYQRIEDNGFDNGVFSSDTCLVVELPQWDTIYSFKVTALNEGGESFPGEILSVSLQAQSEDLVLIVNGFNRVGPPAFMEGETAGIAWWEDEGVPWYRDLSHTGKQYNYDRSSIWLDDDSPGHGASHADMEGQIIPGNSFDFVFVHGKAIRDAGYAFVSVSDEVFASDDFDPMPYTVIDLLYGEERGTQTLDPSLEKQYRVFSPGTRKTLQAYLLSGGNVFVSGAYIGTDPVDHQDTATVDFLKEFMHYRWMTNHADNLGTLKVTDRASSGFLPKLNYNVEYHPTIYKVEAPDGIEPVGDGAFSIFRYISNNVSAGVGYSGQFRSVALGFPFETITSEQERVELMKQILMLFTEENK